MADFKSTVYKIQNGELAQKIPMGEFIGRERVLYVEAVIGQAVADVADTVSFCKLPKGARVTGWKILSPSLGSTGIFDLGHKASADGSIVADTDAFGTGLDAGGQAVLGQPTASDAGLFKKFDQEVDVIATFTEATTAATSPVIKLMLHYVID